MLLHSDTAWLRKYLDERAVYSLATNVWQKVIGFHLPPTNSLHFLTDTKNLYLQVLRLLILSFYCSLKYKLSTTTQIDILIPLTYSIETYLQITSAGIESDRLIFCLFSMV